MTLIKSIGQCVSMKTLFLGVSNPVSTAVLGFTDVLESLEPGLIGLGLVGIGYKRRKIKRA